MSNTNNQIRNTLNNTPPKTKKPEREGREPGTQGAPIAKWKRELMFQTYGKMGNITQVAHTCKVSVMTARKYKCIDQWDERLDLEVRHQAQEVMRTANNDNMDLAAATKIAVSELRIARGRALEALARLEFKKPSDAWRIFIEAWNKELELLGHAAPKEINVILLAAQRYQERSDACSNAGTVDVTASAEVTDVTDVTDSEDEDSSD